MERGGVTLGIDPLTGTADSEGVRLGSGSAVFQVRGHSNAESRDRGLSTQIDVG